MIDTHTRFFEKKERKYKKRAGQQHHSSKASSQLPMQVARKNERNKRRKGCVRGIAQWSICGREKIFKRFACVHCANERWRGDASQLAGMECAPCAVCLSCVDRMWISCVCVAILDWCTRLPVRGLPIRRSVYSFCAHKTIGAGQLGRTTEALVACKLSSL